ncbi:MAG: RNA polymerase sigma factor [Anaerolineales bacterium]
MLDPDSSALAERAQGGDVDAIGVLYDQHHEALFRYVWSRVGERQLAEDLTGDIFMRMVAALPRYRPSAAPFRAWLYGIARNRLIDHYRRQRGREPLPLAQAEEYGLHDGDEGDPSSLLEYKLTIEQVHRALKTLEATQREVVALRFLSGLSLQEVAAALEKSEGAVKALQHRGLAALRRALAQEQVLL